MESSLQVRPQNGPSHFQNLFMSSLCVTLRPRVTFTSSHFRSLFCPCALASKQAHDLAQVPILESPISRSPELRKAGVGGNANGNGSVGVRRKVGDAQLNQKWIDSLTCPFAADSRQIDCNGGGAGSDWVIGVDPDVSGALALLKGENSGLSAQVFDSPAVPIVVGKRTRRRLDPKSIVQLLRSFDAPMGTKAYIEQSAPFPKDGKQGWWSGGFGYGLWIGILVASGFTVVPVSSSLWKNVFELSGSSSTKDDSRRVASSLFPSLSDQLKRKKDHGRAEALLIAAYGKGLKLELDSSCIIEEPLS